MGNSRDKSSSVRDFEKGSKHFPFRVTLSGHKASTKYEMEM